MEHLFNTHSITLLSNPLFILTGSSNSGGYGSGGSGGGIEDDVAMPNYVKQVEAMMKRQKAAREAAKAKGLAAENMRKASEMEEEIKQKKEEGK